MPKQKTNHFNILSHYTAVGPKTLSKTKGGKIASVGNYQGGNNTLVSIWKFITGRP